MEAEKEKQRKVKTLRQLATEYGVCENTMRKWLKPIEGKLKRRSGTLNPRQVKMVYEFLDEP